MKSDHDWRILSSENICETPHLRVERQRIATPTRPDGVSWIVAQRHTAAVVAPRTVDGKFILIRQERLAVQRVLWEFPAGQVDGEVNDTTIYQTALRELGRGGGCVVSARTDSPGLFLFLGGIYRRMLSSLSGPGRRSARGRVRSR